MAFDIHTKFGVHCNAITAAELVEANAVDATLAEIVDRIAAAGFCWSYIDVEPVAIVPAGTALNAKAVEWLAVDQRGADLAALMEHFPDFDVATLPTIPAEWKDVSWKNDASPCFETPSGLFVYVDYAETAEREFPDGKRFTVVGTGSATVTLLHTDDWQSVVSFVAGIFADA